jgi:2-haloacid dehalogenase
MVAAHAWDTTGAQRAGCRAAFVARSGKRLSAVDPQPDVVGPTLTDVADRLLDRPNPDVTA